MRLSVPGNLLLAGEYLVLNEGGQGLAVAVEPRLQASATPSSDKSWSIRAIMGKTMHLWHPGAGDNLPLADALMLSCAEALEFRGRSMPDPLTIEVDSSAFFSSDGRKAGFGSSAAAAVAIAMLTGRSAGLKDTELIDFSVEAALAGHRAAQGGRGSGYDIFASLHGGCGIFTGGEKPDWQALGGLPPIKAVLVPGPAAVRSADAVSAFRLWLAGQSAKPDSTPVSGMVPEAALLRDPASILDAMKTGVQTLVAATVSKDAAAFRKALTQAGAAGRLLGDAIGYSAFIRAPEPFHGLEVKALGAGNELGLMILDMPAGVLYPESLPPACLPFLPSGGPLWLS